MTHKNTPDSTCKFENCPEWWSFHLDKMYNPLFQPQRRVKNNKKQSYYFFLIRSYMVCCWDSKTKWQSRCDDKSLCSQWLQNWCEPACDRWYGSVGTWKGWHLKVWSYRGPVQQEFSHRGGGFTRAEPWHIIWINITKHTTPCDDQKIKQKNPAYCWQNALAGLTTDKRQKT